MKKNKNLLIIAGAGVLAYLLFFRKKEATTTEQPQLSKINPKVFNKQPTTFNKINVRRAVDGVIY
jgi:hypothetical protein